MCSTKTVSITNANYANKRVVSRNLLTVRSAIASRPTAQHRQWVAEARVQEGARLVQAAGRGRQVGPRPTDTRPVSLHCPSKDRGQVKKEAVLRLGAP